MDRETFEQKTGLRIVEAPALYQDDDTGKIEVEMPCGHQKRVKISSAVKRKQCCTICQPRPRKVGSSDTDERLQLLAKLEAMRGDDLKLLLASLNTSALKRLLEA